MKEHLALLASGQGSTVEAILKAAREGLFRNVVPVVVIVNKQHIGAIEKARKLHCPVEVVSSDRFKRSDEFGALLQQILHYYSVDIVSQNGWLVYTHPEIVKLYKQKIINQHNGALDPATHTDFGGKNMHSLRTIGAHIAFNWITGESLPIESTIHHVTPQLDQGALIRVIELPLPKKQNVVTVADILDNPQELVTQTHDIQQQFLPLEHQNVIETLKYYDEYGKFPSYQRQQPLIPQQHTEALRHAKNVAVEVFRRK